MNEKVIVITGASSGIGEAVAQTLVKKGHNVVIAARREEKLKQITQELKDEKGNVAYVVTDVTNRSDVDDLAKQTLNMFGRIDVWVNNAGIMALSNLDSGRVDEWDQMIDINIKGVLYGINSALPSMRKQNSGQFINISSVSGHKTGAGSAVYAATKFGVRAISETLREEEALANSNIRVTTISPGAIDTELPSSVKDQNIAGGINEFYENLAIPAERIAKAILFAIDIDEDTGINEILLRPTNQPL